MKKNFYDYLLITVCLMLLSSIIVPWAHVFYVPIYGYNYIRGTFASSESTFLMALLIFITALALLQSVLQAMNRVKTVWFLYTAYGLSVLAILYYFCKELAVWNEAGPIVVAVGGTIICGLSLVIRKL